MRLSAFLVVFLSGFTLLHAQQTITVDVGDPAVEVMGYDEAGKPVRLSDYSKEKYVLLNFTATYCGPCWKTYQHMNDIQENYKEDLKVISVHWDDLREQWSTIAQNKNIEFQCTSLWEVRDKKKIMDTYQIDGWPYYFIIDKNGMIVAKWFGARGGKLKRMIRKHLR